MAKDYLEIMGDAMDELNDWPTSPRATPGPKPGGLLFVFSGAPATTQPARFSIIPQPQQFVNRQFTQIFNIPDARNLCILPKAKSEKTVDKTPRICYTVIRKGKEIQNDEDLV